MVDEQRCSREGGREGVIKLSASLLEWSCSDWERGGRKEKERESEGKAGEVLQILACKWAQVHVCAPYVHVCVCVCVWRGGGSSLGAAADVSVLNDHSACSVWEALALHKGVCVCVCVKRRGGLHSEAECSPQHHAGPKTPNYSPFFFFLFSPPLRRAARRATTSHWIDLEACEALCHAEWILTD